MNPDAAVTTELWEVPTAKQSLTEGHDTEEICDMSGGIDDSTVHGGDGVADAGDGPSASEASPATASTSAPVTVSR